MARTKNPKYYVKVNNKYIISKQIKSKTVYYGTYPTEKEVKQRVEFLKKHNWDTKYKQYVRSGTRAKYYTKIENNTYVISKNIKNKTVYFGTYATEDEARQRVEFLKKHNWDTKYKQCKHTKTNPKYYVLNRGKYIIQKSINNKLVYFGRYDTEAEAKKQVEYLKKHNWDKSKFKPKNQKINYIHKFGSKYAIYKVKNKKLRYYGLFKTKTEARQRVKFLEQHNWDTKYIVLHQKHPMQKKASNLPKYIQYNKYENSKYKYKICKWVDGKLNTFGLFKTLKEAIKERDLFIKYGWDWDMIELF